MITDFNFLKTNSFTFNLQRLPETIFRCRTAGVPAITVPAPQTGGTGPIPQYFPGSATEFEAFSMVFAVDENLKNYEELYLWIVQQRFRRDVDAVVPRNSNEELLVSDGFLTTLTNNSNPNRVFKFLDMFPIYLGGLEFDTESTTNMSCSATFRYSYFKLQ